LSLPLPVLQLAWRPPAEGESRSSLELAVAGDDSSLRIYKLTGI